jgi:hypothetical protein
MLTFRPMYRANPISDDAVAKIPLIYIASDINDIVSWSAISEAQSADNVSIRDDSGAFSLILKPRASLALFGGGVFTSYGEFDSWVDTVNTNVPYFGVKWAISGSGFAAAHYQSWNVVIRERVSFRCGA